MAIFRMFVWHVTEGKEAEHEAAMEWHLRHWIQKHPRVLSVRYFAPHASNQQESPRKRICIVESESLDQLQALKTVERNPECPEVLAAVISCVEGGAWTHTLWEDRARPLWKEPGQP